MTLKLTEEEWSHHRGNFDGICLACGEWTTGGVEPDAHNYKCEGCRRMQVMGAEDALFGGHIELEEETDE